jgi:hypothetical protein
LVADAGQDLIAFLSWRRRNSVVVNPFLTTPNVRVRRKIAGQIFALPARSASRIEPAPNELRANQRLAAPSRERSLELAFVQLAHNHSTPSDPIE